MLKAQNTRAGAMKVASKGQSTSRVHRIHKCSPRSRCFVTRRCAVTFSGPPCCKKRFINRFPGPTSDITEMLLTTTGYRPHLKPQTSDFVHIIGLDWCGSTIKSKLVPHSSLQDHHLTENFWQEWRLMCCWYEVIGGARPIHKLKSRSESIRKLISSLRLEPQSNTVLSQIQALNEELLHVESHAAYLQVSVAM